MNTVIFDKNSLRQEQLASIRSNI